jgi:hypothetical protein
VGVARNECTERARRWKECAEGEESECMKRDNKGLVRFKCSDCKKTSFSNKFPYFEEEKKKQDYAISILCMYLSIPTLLTFKYPKKLLPHFTCIYHILMAYFIHPSHESTCLNTTRQRLGKSALQKLSAAANTRATIKLLDRLFYLRYVSYKEN